MSSKKRQKTSSSNEGTKQDNSLRNSASKQSSRESNLTARREKEAATKAQGSHVKLLTSKLTSGIFMSLEMAVNTYNNSFDLMAYILNNLFEYFYAWPSTKSEYTFTGDEDNNANNFFGSKIGPLLRKVLIFMGNWYACKK